MKEQLALLPGLLTAHLELALIALLLGAAASIPLGVWMARREKLQTLVLTCASVIQTIPSLALLAIMVPVLAALGHLTQQWLGFQVPSIGFLPALIALVLYSILPILRNTVTGLASVDPALLEAALGVGMTPRQRLWRVELPQALPMIVAGVRTATVWVVGMTVLSTPVGAASLGNYIFTGLQTRNFNAVMVGCVSAAGLAMLLDWLIRSVEVGMQGRRRRRLVVGLTGLFALYGCVGVVAVKRFFPDGNEIRIGAKTFTEQYILAELLAQKLRVSTGKTVHIVQSLGSIVAYDALKNGAIDAYVDYSGTVWTTVMKRNTGDVARKDLLREVGQHLRSQDHIDIAAVLGFENTYALAMRNSDAEAQKVRSVEQLGLIGRDLRIAGDYEFFGRSEWRGLQSTYGLAFAEQRSMDPALMYQAIQDNAVDVIAAYTTDGRLEAYHLRMLEDTRQVIPPYDALVLAGSRLQGDKAAMQALKELAGAIDVKAMQHMNYSVDHDQKTPSEVAREFLRAHNLNH